MTAPQPSKALHAQLLVQTIPQNNLPECLSAGCLLFNIKKRNYQIQSLMAAPAGCQCPSKRAESYAYLRHIDKTPASDWGRKH